MPSGIPVATVALNGAINAGILAMKILAISDESIYQRLEEYQKSLTDKVLKSVDDMKGEYPNFYDLEL